MNMYEFHFHDKLRVLVHDKFYSESWCWIFIGECCVKILSKHNIKYDSIYIMSDILQEDWFSDELIDLLIKDYDFSIPNGDFIEPSDNLVKVLLWMDSMNFMYLGLLNFIMLSLNHI